MICPNCNEHNNDDALVCEKCGYDFTKAIIKKENNQGIKKLDRTGPSKPSFENLEEKSQDVKGLKGKNKKILKIIIAGILVITICLGVFYAISPRKFAQTFFSNSKYTQLVITKKLRSIQKSYKELMPEKSKTKDKLTYDVNSSIKFEMDDKQKLEVFGDVNSVQQILDYLNTLKIKGTYSKDGTLNQEKMSIADFHGDIISFSSIKDSGLTMIDSMFNLMEFRNLQDLSNSSDDKQAIQKKSLDEIKKIYLDSGYIKYDSKKDSKWITSNDTIEIGSVNKILTNMKDIEKQKKQIAVGFISVMGEVIADLDEKNHLKIVSDKTVKYNSYEIVGDEIVFSMSSKEFKNCINKTRASVKDNEDIYTACKSIYNDAVKNQPEIKKSLKPIFGEMTKNDYKKIIDKVFDCMDIDSMELGSDIKIRLNVDDRNNLQAIVFEPIKDVKLGIIFKTKSQKSTCIYIKIKDSSCEVDFKKIKENMYDAKLSFKDKKEEIFTVKLSLKNVKRAQGVITGEINMTTNIKTIDEQGKKSTNTFYINFDSKSKGKNIDMKVTCEVKELAKAAININLTNKKFEKIKIPSKENVINMYDKKGTPNKEYNTYISQVSEDVMSNIYKDHQELLAILMMVALSKS